MGPIFFIKMTKERFILFSLSKKRPRKNFQTQGVSATGDWACAPRLQQYSVSNFFETPWFKDTWLALAQPQLRAGHIILTENPNLLKASGISV